jgi:hypothetical protein
LEKDFNVSVRFRTLLQAEGLKTEALCDVEVRLPAWGRSCARQLQRLSSFPGCRYTFHFVKTSSERMNVQMRSRNTNTEIIEGTKAKTWQLVEQFQGFGDFVEVCKLASNEAEIPARLLCASN